MGTRYKGTARDVLALDTFIKLLRAANTVQGALSTVPAVRDRGITATQLGVLEAVLHVGPMTQSQLCDKLLTSGSNLTTVLDNLERRGWVRRERSASDRRVQVVHLTPAGRETIEAVFPAHVARIAELFGALSMDEQRDLGRLCRKLGVGNAR
jgi:MarR family transcriptional regulator, 2-MHQ and catechol-resistance regulon repressor